MSKPAVSWVRSKAGRARTPVQQQVLEELALAADDEGRGAARSYRWIAGKTVLHRNTVLRALRDLELEDRIRRHRGGREHCEHCRKAGGRAVYDVAVPAQIQVPDGQLNLIADGTRNGTSEGVADVPSPDRGWHTTGATSGTPGVPPSVNRTPTSTPSSLTHAASGVGPEDQKASRGEDFQVTSRAQAQAVPCPACSATAGRSCLRSNGAERVQFHRQRHAAAIAAGAEPVDPAAARTNGATRRPGTRSNGTNPRARGANPRARAARGDEPGVDDRLRWQAMRDLLSRAVPEDTWDMWLAPLALVGRDGDALVLGAPAPGFLQASFAGLLDNCATEAGVSGVRLVDTGALL